MTLKNQGKALWYIWYIRHGIINISDSPMDQYGHREFSEFWKNKKKSIGQNFGCNLIVYIR